MERKMMDSYDPSQIPDPDEWLALDELERINLVENYHKGSEEKIPEGSEKMHAAIHAAVENQLASAIEPVSAVVAKLVRQGLGRHEALHAIGAVLSEDLFNLQQGEGEPWDQNKYQRRLEKLSAKRWKRGQW